MYLGDSIKQTLQHFRKILPGKKGIERNLWVKKFIKNIIYSKDFIEVSLYYKGSCDEKDYTETPSGRVRATAGQNSNLPKRKRRNSVVNDQISPSSAFKLAPDSESQRTIPIILPNTIHNCKKKNLQKKNNS